MVRELSKAEMKSVVLLSNALEKRLLDPVEEVNYLLELLETENISNEYIDLTAESIVRNRFDILSIEITDPEGYIEKIYPYDNLKVGLDISGYDYYKEAIIGDSIYWSSSFLSSHFNASTVTFSIPCNGGLLTVFLSLKDITLEDIGAESNSQFTITDQLGVYIHHMNNDRVRFREQDKYFNKNKEEWTGEIIQRVIKQDGIRYFSYSNFIPGINWMITLYKPVSILMTPLRRTIFILVVITTLLVLIGVRFASRVIKHIINPIESLVDFTKDIANGDHNCKVPETRIYELTTLARSFEEMSKSIRLTEDELKDLVKVRTEELEESQKQLILSEKMAALGGLVAGVAHEINTPLGIIVTSASYLDMVVTDFMELENSKQMTRTKFHEMNTDIKETAKLILGNSKKAAELIKSFKEVAVDQTSDDKRNFKLGGYTKEIIQSLHHKFKNTSIDVNVKIVREIEMETFPGAYSQIITNFMTNSLVHGFEERVNGEIIIQINEIDSETAEVIYRDTGKGVDGEHLDKIFDPFFTTRRNQGGSGLGLNIVYNLVTQRLLGSIEGRNHPEGGLEFMIRIPIRINSEV